MLPNGRPSTKGSSPKLLFLLSWCVKLDVYPIRGAEHRRCRSSERVYTGRARNYALRKTRPAMCSRKAASFRTSLACAPHNACGRGSTLFRSSKFVRGWNRFPTLRARAGSPGSCRGWGTIFERATSKPGRPCVSTRRDRPAESRRKQSGRPFLVLLGAHHWFGAGHLTKRARGSICHRFGSTAGRSRTRSKSIRYRSGHRCAGSAQSCAPCTACGPGNKSHHSSIQDCFGAKCTNLHPWAPQTGNPNGSRG